MSLALPTTVNQSAVKPISNACYDNNQVNSQGIFLGDQPLKFALPLFLLEISIIFLATSAAHFILRRVGQCRFTSQMLIGIFLGPSVLGHSVKFRRAIFPERGNYILETVSLVSLILFLFSTGIKTDLSLVRKPGRRAVAIGVAGSVLPLALSLAIFYSLRSTFPDDLRQSNLIFDLAVRLSLSSFPVIADALGELRLLNSELGRIAMSAALITDICSWFMWTAFIAVGLVARANSPTTAAEIVVSFLAFTLFVVAVCKPAAAWIVKKQTPAGELLGEGYFVGFVMLALLSALVTELIGFKYMLGPFMLGLVLPGGMPLGVTMTERMDSFFTAIFLPIYIVLAGYRADFAELNDVKGWSMVELVVALCFVGKLVGSAAVALYYEMPVQDAFCVGLMLNFKGVVEIAFISNWGNAQRVTVDHYTILIISMLVITAVSTPLVKLVYNPTARFLVHKRRTIEHAKPHSELRLLACLHNEDHVAPVLDLLEASAPSRDLPVSLAVLHLTELSGRSASYLRPHKQPRRRPGSSNSHNDSHQHHHQAPSASDRIVNAFRYFEQQQAAPGAVAVHPFVCAAPFATMHHDVCALALNRKARLVLLPFHKHSDGARETARNAFQAVNRAVLRFAPCSVAVLVDRALPAGGAATCARTNSLLQRAAVYFLGGPDDREALALAARMAAGGAVSLTVVRFRLRLRCAAGEDADADAEDEAAVEGFRERHAGSERVVYTERMVEDGEGTAGVMRGMSEKFDLVVVGRGGREDESGLTSGLSEWSECPELGVVGDMLASTDFGGKLSILVVQQQERLRSEHHHHTNGPQEEEVKNVLIHGPR
uniref:Uncharacterized protein n=1 Tax=Ananas comosus var. bracteatus TaxID=296719 RepID=A0A6V7NG48_ANACO|nr:unnamed protein product [Ananas comosus var. bracteatus]